MHKKILLVASMLFCALSSVGCKVVRAQGPPTAGYVVYQNYVPSGTCTLPNYLTVVTVGTGNGVYQCMGIPLTWTMVAPISSSGNGITQLTGDGTAGPGTGSQVFTLATVITPNGACGDATHVCSLTYDGKGRILSATSILITGSGSTTPGGSPGQGQWNSAGSFGGYTTSGDCTQNFSTGVITCTKTNGSNFAPSATTDTTNGANISSGTFLAARMPAFTGDAVNSVGAVAITVKGINGVILSTLATGPLCNTITTGVPVACTTSALQTAIGAGVYDASGAAAAAQTAAIASANATAANASNLTSGTIPAARLPNPTASTLGGIESAAVITNNYIDSISTGGVPHLSQPSFANLSGSLATTQAPTAITGILQDTAGTVSQATGHQIILPYVCADSSASGTAQSCTTAPSFTPVANDCVVYTTTTANSGAGLTLNVNALGAKSVAKWLGATTLAANDVKAGQAQYACYNGTVWNLSTIGNAPSGSGNNSVGANGAVQGSNGSGAFTDTGCTNPVSGTINCATYGSNSATTQNAYFMGVGTGSIPVTGVPTNYAGWAGPPSGTPSYLATLPNANPSAKGIMEMGAAATVNGVSQSGVTQIPISFSTQTDSASVTWAVASETFANTTLTMVHTTSTRAINVSNLVNGGSYTLILKQDATGGALATLGTGCTWLQGTASAGYAANTTLSVTATASAVNLFVFTYDGTNCYGNLR